MLEDIKNILLELENVDEVKNTVNEHLESGVDPITIIDILNETLNEVGEKYESGDLFLSELMMVGYLASEITKLLKPYLREADITTYGKIVIGTVDGDIHDIGKNIVIMMLQSAGFQVVDLGVDVSADRFVETIKEEKPDVLGMSALLTSTMNEMRVVIDSLETSGLRKNLKVIVGGRPITRKFSSEIGADGYAKDAVKTIKVIKNLMGIKEND